MKRMLSAILALVLILTSMLCATASASSEKKYPSVSSKKYIEFKAQNKISVYKDTACKTRGTSSPEKKYDAYIAKGDVCHIFKIDSSYIEINYPTDSGRKTGYIKRSDLFDKTEPEEIISSAKASVTVHKANGDSSIAKGDKVWRVDPTVGHKGYRAVIYEAKSGSRAYKMGYITLDDLEAIKTGSSNVFTDTASNDSYKEKADSFLNDKRWKVGTSWGDAVGPKLSNYGSSGCCAYAADFVKYVFNADSPRNENRRFNKASEIKSGDVLYVEPMHWMVVLNRTGNEVDIIHGNWTKGKVCRNTYTLKGTSIGGVKTFKYGYHFQ